MFRSLKTVAILAFGVLALAPRASATSITFDFESSSPTYVTPPQGGTRPGALTSLVLTSGGEIMTITRQNGTAFDLVSNTGNQAGKPAGWGVVSLDPFFDPRDSGWIFNFSQAISGFTVQFGDYGQDSDSEALSAWSGAGGTGSLVDSVVNNYGVSAFPTFATPGLSGAGILSFTINGTSNTTGFNNSVFLDNVVVTTPATVPEPSSMVLLSTGIAAMVSRYRRRRSKPNISQQ